MLQVPRLPDDVVSYIFRFVESAKDVLACAQVCKRWNRLANDRILWHRLAVHHWKLSPSERLPLNKNSWKHFYLHQQLVNNSWSRGWSRGEYRETTLAGHDGRVTNIDFKHYLLASAGYDGMRIWNLDSMRCSEVIPNAHVGPVHNVRLFDGFSTVASSGADRTVRIWDMQRSVCKQTFEGHQGETFGLSIVNDDPNLLFSSSFDKTCKLWDLRCNSAVRTFSGDSKGTGHTGAVFAIQYLQGKLLSGGGDACVKGEKKRYISQDYFRVLNLSSFCSKKTYRVCALFIDLFIYFGRSGI